MPQTTGPTLAGLAVGTILQDTYRIVRPLAHGGCGEVYLADHTRLPGQFAVKVLHRNLLHDAESLSRFRQEAAVTSALRHPHIVQVFDFNLTDDGLPYLVMELLEGQLLATRVSEGGALDPLVAANIVDQIADALHAAHTQGIVHRDLKPDNVMLLSGDGFEDFVKVVDFGISQASWGPRLTSAERVAGTPRYMSPEQACGLRDQIDHRSDQFSLAAIAYKLLTGVEPFIADDPIAILYQVVHANPVPPSERVTWLGNGVDAVVMRGLSKKATDRYDDIQAFAAALRGAIIAISVAPIPSPQATDADVEPPPIRPAPFQPAQALEFEAPAVRAPVRASETEPAPRQAFELASTMPSVSVVQPLAPAGRETMRLIRKVRGRSPVRRMGLLMLALAGVGAAAWFSPPTRDVARATWARAQTDARQVYGRAIAAPSPQHGQEPSPLSASARP